LRDFLLFFSFFLSCVGCRVQVAGFGAHGEG
jgi:hypothetical protein